jgi:protein TonB
MQMERRLFLLKTLAAICPLLGLLGTVTGMIVIFDVMGILPNLSPRAVAGGVSKATVTTMAGMVGALSGFFPAIWLHRLTKARARQLKLSHADGALPVPRFRLSPVVRYVASPIAAALVTCGLLIGMEQMILYGNAAASERVARFRVDYIRIPREPVAQARREAPQKPADLAEPPDLALEPSTQTSAGLTVAAPTPTASMSGLFGLEGLALRASFGGTMQDGDYLPVVKVEPVYPSRALARRLEGWVLLRFTVTGSGAVRDIEVVESSDTIFESSAIDAAGRFKYRPRIIDGQPIEVRGVLHRVSFVLG